MKLPSQQRAKQALLNKFGLIRAEPSTLMNDDDSEFTSEIKPVVYGLVISLSCLLIVLIILCCRQRRKHAKRLRGAGVADYSAVAMTRTLPRTGICHSKLVKAINFFHSLSALLNSIRSLQYVAGVYEHRRSRCGKIKKLKTTYTRNSLLTHFNQQNCSIRIFYFDTVLQY